MYIQQLSLKNSLVLVLLVLFSVDQALSLHCYECASFTDGPCSSPNQNHVAECSIQKLMSPLDSSSTFLERTFKSVGSFPPSGTIGDVEFECGKFTGTNTTANNRPMVVRGCLLKLLPCEAYQKIMGQLGFSPGTCERCDKDLCNSELHNSSSNLSIGFWSLCVSLAMLVMLRS